MSTTDHSTGVAFLPNLATGATDYEPEVGGGRFVVLSGTPLPIPCTDYIYWYDKTLGVQSFDNTGNTEYIFDNVTIQNIITTAGLLDQTSIDAINLEPNIMTEWGINGTHASVNVTLGAGDAHYMCGEKEGAFCVDDKAGYGVELTVSGDFNSSTGWIAETEAEIIGGKCEFRYVADTAIIVRQGSGVFFENVTYIIEAEVSNYISGTFEILINQVKPIKAITSNGIFTGIITTGTIAPANWEFQVRGLTNAVFDIEYVSAREATAAEITSYTAANREANQTTGAMVEGFVLDGAGVPTAVADTDTLMIHSDTSMDTGLLPNLTVQTLVEEVSGELMDFDNMTRASTATYVDGAVLKYAAIDEMRWEDGVALVEAENTALNLRSSEFSATWWVKGDSILTPDVITAPDDIDTADLVEFPIDGANIQKVISDFVIGNKYYASGFIKQNVGRYVYVGISVDGSIEIDLDNNVISNTGNSSYSNLIVMANGWLRWEIECTTTATTRGIRPAAESSTIVAPSSFYIWGYNYGTNEVGSYIPTVDGAVTRAVDIVSTTQRQEERVLTTVPTYYINKVLQDYVPTSPEPTVTMKLDNTAIIGYPDTVTQRHGRLKMKRVELTQAEIDAL